MSEGIATAVRTAGWYAYSVGIDDGQHYAPLSQLDDDERSLEYVPNAQQLGTLPDALKAAGWEGDGRIQYMILPPYLSADSDGDTHWFPVFFVKQSNNGSGFLAALRALPISTANSF
jgi:hypothetical protein